MNRQTQIFLVVLVLFGGLISLLLTFARQYECKIDFTRHFTQTDHFVFSWQLDNILLEHYQRSKSTYNPPLFTSNRHLLAIGTANCDDRMLLKIDESGNLEEIDFINFHGITRHITDVVHDDGTLFLALAPSRRVNPTTNPNAWGLGKIVSYDIQSNKIEWEIEMPGVVGSMFVSESILATEVMLDNIEYYLIDTRSGEAVSEPLQDTEINYSINDPYTDTYNDPYKDAYGILYAIWSDYIHEPIDHNLTVSDITKTIDNLSDKSSQSLAINQAIEMTEDYIIIKYGLYSPYERPNRIAVLDKGNNQILWQTTDNVASNVAISTDYVFYVTNDAQVIASDLENGRQIGYIEFSSDIVNTTDYPNVFIEANEDNSVFIYFPDSRQIFSFTLSEKGS